jgi:hypothetical protein
METYSAIDQALAKSYASLMQAVTGVMTDFSFGALAVRCAFG